MIRGSAYIFPWCMTSLINGRDEIGSTRLHTRFTTIRQKLPAISHFRGRISFHTSGSTFFNFGLGRLLVRSAPTARPVPRLDRSAACIPPPIPDDPNDENIHPKCTLYPPSHPKHSHLGLVG